MVSMPENEWSDRLKIRPDEALVIAAAQGDENRVRRALDAGADIHRHSDSALRRAAGFGYNRVIGLLLAKGADIHAADDDALRAAVRGGHVSTAKYLLQNGANPNAADGEALVEACNRGLRDCVRDLLAHGADVSVSNDHPLRQASYAGDVKIVQLLVEAGADVFSMHGSALNLAVAEKHMAVVDYLATVMHERREMFKSAVAGMADTRSALRQTYCEPDGKDRGESFLHRAVRMNAFPEVSAALQRCGDFLSEADLFGLRARDGRRLADVAADRGQLRHLFNPDLWRDGVPGMLAAWKKLTPHQQQNGGMPAETVAALAAEDNQKNLREKSRNLQLKPPRQG